jgi:hypothetical protein
MKSLEYHTTTPGTLNHPASSETLLVLCVYSYFIELLVDKETLESLVIPLRIYFSPPKKENDPVYLVNCYGLSVSLRYSYMEL